MKTQNSNLTRRKFLETSLGCILSAGAAAMPKVSRPYDKLLSFEDAADTLIIRKLGRTNIKLPIVNAGAGSNNDPRFIQACVEIGMRLFDTDARYQNGNHERLLGRIFSRMGVRDKVIIMTKVHTPEQRVGLSPEESKRLLYKTFEGCLKRLKTDYVDILLVHDVSSANSIKDPAIMEAMTRLKEQGKTRYIGTATHANMAISINATVEAEIYDVVLTSVNFTMADDSKLLNAINNAYEKGVGVIAMKTQAGGSAFPNPTSLRNYSDAVINSAALKWVCNNEYIATSIPGISNYEHLQTDYAIALNPKYTDEERQFLSDNNIKLSMEFCRQCRNCLASCPEKVDIPSLMRTHMYTRQYGNFELARQTIDLIPNNRGISICASCSECLARCANSVNIKRKIEELKLIYA